MNHYRVLISKTFMFDGKEGEEGETVDMFSSLKPDNPRLVGVFFKHAIDELQPAIGESVRVVSYRYLGDDE